MLTHKIVLRLFILLGQFLLLLCCLFYADYVYRTDIRPDQLALDSYHKTKCLIMSKKLSTKGHYFRRYRADFLVNYHANGAQYNRWVSGNGLDMSYTRDSASQEQLLSDYENGVNYPCWYKHDDAESSFLVPRKKWFFLTPLILPAVIALILLICFIRSIFVLLGARKTKHIKAKK